MLGNDVVDLRDPEIDPRRLHPRFDRRVFGDDERAAIAGAADPLRTRWRLWAAKEAAYKAARRMDGRTVWSPVRFRVSLAPSEPRVEHGGRRFALRFDDDEGRVHALAWAAGVTGVVHAVERAASAGAADPSAAVRALACRVVAERLDVAASALEVRRRERIPDLFRDGAPVGGALSLSHHGGLVAFAWLPADGAALAAEAADGPAPNPEPAEGPAPNREAAA